MAAPRARCEQCPDGQTTVFCNECGKVLDRTTLRSVKIAGGFLGTESINPNMEQFWATGDPAVFDTPG